MTREEAAEALDQNVYGNEGSIELFAEMKANGLVAMFGASDDVTEVRGAINDEIGCYDSATIYLTPQGLLKNDCENDDCPHFEKIKEKAATIEALWDQDIYSWSYDARIIPHSTFIILEDGEPFCRGIVFALKDVPS